MEDCPSKKKILKSLCLFGFQEQLGFEKFMKIWKVGFLINPIAGMGGTAGLKGTDGPLILEKARNLGAIPQANERAKIFLIELASLQSNLAFISIQGIMGGGILHEMGFNVDYVSHKDIPNPTRLFETESIHTKLLCRQFKALSLDILIFIGGDGTARDVFTEVGTDIPCLGIPGGVKIHSSVFATNPQAGALLIKKYMEGKAFLRESEVLDINEAAFRDNRVEARLFGYLKTPYLPQYSQASKMASPQTEEEHDNQFRIAQYLINQMDIETDDFWYLLGPGTTTRAICEILEQEKSLLGVDLFHNKELIAKDLNEQDILQNIQNKHVKLIVTPIGAQGFIFGRGNLQLSPQVLNKIGLRNIIIIATKFKVATLPDGKMRIDSRDPKFDRQFSGLHRIIVDYGELIIAEVSSSQN
jgi:predicted polyphosphate/ATP-dependent NAD kinase